MPLQQTSGAASYDAFGGGAAAKVNYIEDFFQSYLRTGTGASATVTTGLDGSTKETLVWTKSRSAATNHKLTDNVRGATKALSSNTTGAEATDSQGLTAFSATGYTIGTNTDYNNSGATYVDWQWVAQPKFFDVVTYTGTGSSRTVAHNLGSVPGCIIVKRTSGIENWTVYHQSQGANKVGFLNLTNAFGTNNTIWGNTSPISTVFTLGDADAGTNANGSTYVAYLFAHDAGGFGLTGTDNVISCGSYTGNGSTTGPVVTLGYEPQWLMVKNATGVGNWQMVDVMRGLALTYRANLSANLSSAESTSSTVTVIPTATGFSIVNTGTDFNTSGSTYIYIAIRRGPMKVPTSGTSVFEPVTTTSSSTPLTVTTGFPVDLIINTRANTGYDKYFVDRLRGDTTTTASYLISNSTGAESNTTGFGFGLDNNTSVIDNGFISGTTDKKIYWNFRRAPSFFDEVCYTGNSAGITIPHNLAVVPELIIQKRRSGAYNWYVFAANNGYGVLNSNAAWIGTGNGSGTNTVSQATSTTFGYDSSFAPTFAATGTTNVAYLFATCAGVSKVFSYTGNGSSQTINCGFTAGARWIMIKRTNSSGDWYIWDSARGIVSGNDPHLSINTTAAEVTTDDTIDTDSTGFVVNQVSATNVNVSSSTYIGIAIA